MQMELRLRTDRKSTKSEPRNVHTCNVTPYMQDMFAVHFHILKRDADKGIAYSHGCIIDDLIRTRTTIITVIVSNH